MYTSGFLALKLREIGANSMWTPKMFLQEMNPFFSIPHTSECLLPSLIVVIYMGGML
jgi:hypothetical protein